MEENDPPRDAYLVNCRTSAPLPFFSEPYSHDLCPTPGTVPQVAWLSTQDAVSKPTGSICVFISALPGAQGAGLPPPWTVTLLFLPFPLFAAW